ncbi:MAG: DNA topoisomerase (ATP-hydrolyzing) subunit B [Ruminococcaceae bacterium]|nr:DNA topoisomerase (ATP-hydrolyzing) subunit B [Oscillospiraceae bacterium]
MANNEEKRQVYDDSQIQVLEGLEAVRRRPGMYIGSTSLRGLHHLVYEIVDNSIDEALAGRCSNIDVTLLPDGSVAIQDDGQGIPGGIHPKMGIPTLEVIFTVLHAGGKFDGNGYEFSGGLHGVGSSVVNALSEWIELESCYQGRRYTERFERGVVARPFADEGVTEKHGLFVRFKPDDTIFDEVEFDYETLLKRLREQAFLNAGVTISITDKRPQAEKEDGSFTGEVMQYDGGIRNFVTYLNEQKHAQAVHPEVVYIRGEKVEEERGRTIMEVALQYTTTYTETFMTFANDINTHEGGTHEEGFKKALTKVINEYARKYKILKDKDLNLKPEDVREGLTAIVSVKLKEAQFEGQTKTKLGNAHVRQFVDKVVTEKLTEYFEEHPNEGRAIIEKAVLASQAREAARKAREASRRKNPLESMSLPGKLSDCTERNKELTEVYLVEGDSAGGSAKQGRDPRFQAILPLRGKILNVEKINPTKVYANQSVQPIIQALGCGIGPDFDIEKLRYGKIILMADADVDGSHIQILLLTFLFRHMKPLIENGRVFLAKPPLYKIYKRSGRVGGEKYAYTDAERDALLAENKGFEADRYKGLGEMNPDQLWETTMDPERRILLRVTMEDAILCDQIFATLMGDEVEPRRAFIEENARFAENLDI